MNIPSRGSPNSKICFVLDYPEADDYKNNKLFSGSWGRMLDGVISSAGINREECYFTSIIKERPVGGDPEIFITIPKDSKKDVVVTQAYREMESNFYKEVSQINANVFVAVGNISLYALQRIIQVGSRRGSILRGYAPAVKDCKVIPLVHPQTLLKDYLGRRTAIMDLERVKEQAEFHEFRSTPRELITRPSYHGSLEYLDRCREVGRAGFDIEVDKNSREISCISFSYDKHSSISIPFMANYREYFSPPQEKEIWLAIASILEDDKVHKLAHNSLFDRGYIFDKTGIITTNCDDTMVAMGIVTPDYAKTLHFCTSLYTDVPYYKDEGKSRIAGMGGSDDRFWEYNAKDSIVLHEIWDEVSVDLINMGNLPTYERQMAMVDPLIYATTRGMRINLDGKAIEQKRNIEAAAELMVRIGIETGGAVTLSRSYKQIKQYFYFDLNIKPIMQGGKMSTNEKALKKLASKGYGVAARILRARQYENRNSKYLDQPMSPDGRLRGSWNNVGAKTGRFSHSKDIHAEGFPMQTPPKEVREYMLADEGYFIMDIDLSQAESRIVANIAPEQNMMYAFENDIDIHAQTGSMLSNLPVEEVIRQDEEGICCDLGDGLHTWRFWGKKCNHAFNYGEGIQTFATDCEISYQDAKFLHNRYHAIYPGINMFHAWVGNHLRQHNMTLINPYGRVRKFLGRNDNSTVLEAVNFFGQSTVADKMNEEGMKFIWENQQWFHHFEMLNQMHDSIDPQVPLHVPRIQVADSLMRLRDNLYKPITWKDKDFIIPIGLDLGLNLMKGKDHKNEEGVYDKNPLGLRTVDFMKHTEASTLAAELNNVIGHIIEIKHSMING